uniref:Uncharacterized protein n=1 Tax=Brassica oleracea var. oleracea TaxID=109376 RepID=A0A0D3DRM9_BRAOL
MELRKAKLEGEQQFLFDQATTDKLRYLLLLRGTQKKMEIRKAKLEGEQQFLFDQATTDKLRYLLLLRGTQKKMELRKAKLEGEQQFLFDQATTEKLRSGALMFKLIWPIFADRVRLIQWVWFSFMDLNINYQIGWSMELKWQIVVRWLKQRAVVSQLRSVCRMQQVIYNEIFKGNMTKKLDAYSLLKIDPTKVH